MAIRTVDIHPHVISPDTDKYPHAPRRPEQAGWPAKRLAPYEDYLVAMKAAGIDKAAIVQSSITYGFDNSYVADAVAAHPEQFTGVFSVDMMADDVAERIRYWVGRKLSGLRIFTAGATSQADWLANPRTFKGWDAAAELGVPVCLQMRVAGLPQLLVLLKRYRDVPIIIDHFLDLPLEAGPPYSEAEPLLGLVEHTNVYLKLTPVVIQNAGKGLATPESYLRGVVKEFGASRIAWGSDYPANDTLENLLGTTQRALTWASQDDQESIFHRTAGGLYPALKP